MDSMRSEHVPKCIYCGDVARPNILMFNDFFFIPTRMNTQENEFTSFVERCPKPITVIEVGAGRAIPLIRWRGEKLGTDCGATVVRINPQEPVIKAPHISIAEGGARALERINAALAF